MALRALLTILVGPEEVRDLEGIFFIVQDNSKKLLEIECESLYCQVDEAKRDKVYVKQYKDNYISRYSIAKQ